MACSQSTMMFCMSPAGYLVHGLGIYCRFTSHCESSPALSFSQSDFSDRMSADQASAPSLRSPIKSFRQTIAQDENFRRLSVLLSRGLRSAPSATSEYLLEKIPVYKWLPSYSPSWIVNDLIAGVTIGILLVPQSLAYAKVAGIPGQYGLISSWIPTALYTIMGTSKGKIP
jgi:Sulfate permease family